MEERERRAQLLLHTQNLNLCYFNRSPIAIKQRNLHAQQRAQATEMMNVAPQKSLRPKTNFYINTNTGSTDFFALTLLSFTLSQWNEEKR